MRTLTISFILFLLILCGNTRAQSYIHFPDTNAVWHETYINSPPPILFRYQSIGETFYKGDTTFGNLTYHKLYNTIRDIWCSHVILETGYTGALREDTIQRKVFVIDYDENAEHLLYDFTLLPGNLIPHSGGATVSSIDTIVTMDGVSRRRWNTLEGGNNASIIEGIGGTNGLLSNTLILEYPNVTLCFEGDSKQTINVNGDCRVPSDTCFFLGIDNHTDNTIEIYPNPVKVNSNLWIMISPVAFQAMENIEILNIFGQQCAKNIKKESNIVVISPSIPGIYFVRLKLKNCSTLIKRIIVNQ